MMPQKIHKTITQINTEVELLAVKEYDWGAEVFARVVDTGSVGTLESQIPMSAALAYRQLNDLPEDGAYRDGNECTLPALDEKNVWYTHVKVFHKKKV
jgi:hypothetical protein